MDGSFSDFAARPPGVANWEDLLTRLELMPRLLRNALEERTRDRRELRHWLLRILSHELWLSHALDEIRTNGWITPNAGLARTDEDVELDTIVDAVASLRRQNFAAVQRRGLEVWEWSASYPGGRVTAYQLLSSVARHDGEALRAIRTSLHEAHPAC